MGVRGKRGQKRRAQRDQKQGKKKNKSYPTVMAEETQRGGEEMVSALLHISQQPEAIPKAPVTLGKVCYSSVIAGWLLEVADSRCKIVSFSPSHAGLDWTGQ